MAPLRNRLSPTDPKFIYKLPFMTQIENLKSCNAPTNGHDSTVTFQIIVNQMTPSPYFLQYSVTDTGFFCYICFLNSCNALFMSIHYAD